MITINIEVVFGTDVTSLSPNITLSTGATVSPNSGSAQNFTSPINYTVTAQDGLTMQAWIVTVTIGPRIILVPEDYARKDKLKTGMGVAIGNGGVEGAEEYGVTVTRIAAGRLVQGHENLKPIVYLFNIQ